MRERRVRLGLVLSEIGEKAGVQITDEEMQRAMFEQIRQYPGQEKEIYDYFQKNPDAVAGLRAPLYEEEGRRPPACTEVDVTDKTVSKDELLAEDEDEKGSAADAS